MADASTCVAQSKCQIDQRRGNRNKTFNEFVPVVNSLKPGKLCSMQSATQMRLYRGFGSELQWESRWALLRSSRRRAVSGARRCGQRTAKTIAKAEAMNKQLEAALERRDDALSRMRDRG